MSHPSVLARARTTPGRAALTTTMSVLLGALALGVAPAASAATTTTTVPAVTTSTATVSSDVTVYRSARTQTYTISGILLSIRATAAGRTTPGTVHVYDGTDHVAARTLVYGKASVRLSRYLKPGTHTLRVVYVPTAAKAATVRRSASVLGLTVRTKAQALRAAALSYIGVSYRWGGTSASTGFDCSGYTRAVYAKARVADLPRTSSGQRSAGRVVSRANARIGDLIWTPGHVAVYLGGGYEIDAPRAGQDVHVHRIWQSNPTFVRF